MPGRASPWPTPMVASRPDPGRDQRCADSGSCRKIETLDILINNAGMALYDDLSDRAALEQHLAVNLFGTYARDTGVSAAADSFAGSRREQPVGDGPGPLAAHSGLLDLQGGRVQLDAIAARSSGRTGREGACRADRPRGHRYDPEASTYRRPSPESVARAIFDGVEKGEEDIFPDPMSQSMADSWRSGAAKALEAPVRGAPRIGARR